MSTKAYYVIRKRISKSLKVTLISGIWKDQRVVASPEQRLFSVAQRQKC